MESISIVNIAHAQIPAVANTFINNFINAIINPLIYLMMAVAIVVFLWGVVEFISGSDDTTKLSNGRRHMLWGIIGLAIMVSAFGIMNLICNTILC